MAIGDQIKDLIGLVRKMDNIELYEKILNLQESAMDLQEENRRLTDRARALEDKARLQAGLVYRKNLYWKLDKSNKIEEGPYCPRCWDADGKLVHLRDDRRSSYCLNCKSAYDHVDGSSAQSAPSPFGEAFREDEF